MPDDGSAVAATAIPRIEEPRVNLGPAWRYGYGLFITLLYVFLLLPILIVVFASFSPDQRSTYAISQASLRWYRDFLENDSFLSAFKFSLWLGAVAAVLATTIGFLTAYALVRHLGRARNVAQSLTMLPMMVPHIIISLSLLFALNFVSVPELWVLVVGHVMICLPFTIAGIIASLESVDPDLEAAAHTLGASRLRVLAEVTVPLIAPGVLSALIFAFIISFGDVYMALFLSGPNMTTLPVEIFAFISWESSPVVAAITTLQILLIIVFGLVVERLVGLRTAMRL
ncbi:ABC transporter permease [Falsiroseomonas sp. HW251]|uniref:ABC transporter permease n=1 Tax=Falsiroseomonas sp. HW251 TaxID=3390998 RepID=UPI003D31C1F8